MQPLRLLMSQGEMKRKGRQSEKGSQQNTAAAASLQRLTTGGHREQDTHTHRGQCRCEFLGKHIRSAGRQSMILREALQNSTADALFQEANERCGVSVIVFLKPVSPPTQARCDCAQCSLEGSCRFSCCYHLCLFLLFLCVYQ